MRGCRGSSCGLWSFVHFMWLCIRIPSLSPRGKNLGRLSGPAETFHPTDFSLLQRARPDAAAAQRSTI